MSSRETGVSLPHSQSSPSGMDCVSSSPEPKRVGRMMSVEIHFLDDSVNMFQIQYKTLGHILFEQVCRMLNLLEVDYFGLQYSDASGTKYWLDYEKPMCRQLGLTMVNPSLYFCVKFYTPDPAQLEEEYTRYLFTLQLKKDLAQGILQCNDNTAALMASYIVQAECGDYVSEDYPDHTYLSSFKFVPHQDAEFQKKIMENHKKHVGQSPAEADLNLLETARRCELYGIKMTSAKDHEGVPLNLAVAHMGVLVFQNFTKINTFSWAKIRKLSFKRKRFLIKLHPEGYGYYKDTVEFFFEGRNECKNFWKKCIENHAFFRCAEVRKTSRQKTRLFSRGSSFRYSGRTQKQMVEYVRENYVKRQNFQRSTSLRIPSTSHRGVGTVGTSISAQPLLPVSNSQSCGSVILTREENTSPSPSPKLTSASQPSSPRLSQEPVRVVANGSICTEGQKTPDRRDLPPGLQSPDFTHSREGFYSTDYLGNDIDDISHDSYQLEDRDTLNTTTSGDHGDSISLIYSFDQINDESSEFKAPLVNEQNEVSSDIEREKCESLSDKISENIQVNESENVEEETVESILNEDITYVLYRRHLTSNQQFSPQKRKSNKNSRVRVAMEHGFRSHSSPTLYVRANRYGFQSKYNRNRGFPKFYSHTVDFVAVHQLPATKSFSSQDDSVEEKPLEREIFQQVKRNERLNRRDGYRIQKNVGKNIDKSFKNIQTYKQPVIPFIPRNEIRQNDRIDNFHQTKPEKSVFDSNIRGEAIFQNNLISHTQTELDNLHRTEEELSIAAMESLCLEMEGNQVKYYISSGKEIFGYNVFIKDDKQNIKETPPEEKNTSSLTTKDADDNKSVETDIVNDYYSDSSSVSDAPCSHTSTSSSEEMHKLSDSQLFDTQIPSGDEFDGTDDSTQPSHLDEIFSETSHDVAVQTQDQYSLLSQRIDYSVQEDDYAQADRNYSDSLHEGMDMFDDVTEKVESLSEEETAPVVDDPAFYIRECNLRRFSLPRHYQHDLDVSLSVGEDTSSGSSVSPSYCDDSI